MTTHHASAFTPPTDPASILAIPLNKPERLFSGAADALKSEYRTLFKRWHPDLNPDDHKTAEAVSQHISVLHAEAERKLKLGIWHKAGLLSLTATDGKAYKLKYVKEHAFELGKFYISESKVTFLIDKNKGFDDLAANAPNQLKGLAYHDDTMRKEFQRQMPDLVKQFETNDAHVFVFNKDSDMVLLSDLRDYVKQSTGAHLDSKHVAWIMSRLHSLTCFLHYNDLTHNAISADTVFVSPGMHTAVLMGGWWYAAKENTALKGLPDFAVKLAPRDVLADGLASRRVDLELIRMAGRDLLGDPTGSLILRDPSVKKPMAQWLTNVTSGDAIKDFKKWSGDILTESFGARRFIKLDVPFSDVYQPK